MRWIYLAVIVLFALATLIFALQNLEVVAVSFLASRSGRRSPCSRSSSTSSARSRAVVC